MKLAAFGYFGGAALAAFVLAQVPASAQGGGEEWPTHIRFAPGQACWHYHGKASVFATRFNAGQRIVATSTGEWHFETGGSAYIETDRRDVGVSTSWRGDYIPVRAVHEVFSLPFAGEYTFVIGPPSVAGWPGEFIVCKIRDK